jgi:hypothetical protein
VNVLAQVDDKGKRLNGIFINGVHTVVDKV